MLGRQPTAPPRRRWRPMTSGAHAARPRPSALARMPGTPYRHSTSVTSVDLRLSSLPGDPALIDHPRPKPLAVTVEPRQKRPERSELEREQIQAFVDHDVGSIGSERGPNLGAARPVFDAPEVAHPDGFGDGDTPS